MKKLLFNIPDMTKINSNSIRYEEGIFDNIKHIPVTLGVDSIECFVELKKIVGYGNIKNNHMEVRLLNVPETKLLKDMLSEKPNLSCVPRGVGSIKDGLVEDFKIIAFNIMPSSICARDDAGFIGED